MKIEVKDEKENLLGWCGTVETRRELVEGYDFEDLPYHKGLVSQEYTLVMYDFVPVGEIEEESLTGLQELHYQQFKQSYEEDLEFRDALDQYTIPALKKFLEELEE